MADMRMQGMAQGRLSNRAVVTHPLDPCDAQVAATMREAVAPIKGKGFSRGVESRLQFDALMASVPACDGVDVETDLVGGIPGVWVLPSNARPGQAVIHLHGGWFNFGSAEAFVHLVGHIASRAGARAFIPDYRLAPEHPFPAAVEDVLACYRGLREQVVERVALSGDSAGGNLALVLASRVAYEPPGRGLALCGVAVLSPITDLTLSGDTYRTRAEADPLFTRPQALELVRAYLAKEDSTHPLASPLYGRLSGLPPVRVHVGDDEILLSDSLRYVARAAAVGVDARADVWLGMPHGFAGGIGRLKAAEAALDDIGAFLGGVLSSCQDT
jgi:epsilon-lactone hydrolase